jgi:hypothetical protein
MCGRPTYYYQKKFFKVVDKTNKFGFVAESVEEYL